MSLSWKRKLFYHIGLSYETIADYIVAAQILLPPAKVHTLNLDHEKTAEPIALTFREQLTTQMIDPFQHGSTTISFQNLC